MVNAVSRQWDTIRRDHIFGIVIFDCAIDAEFAFYGIFMMQQISSLQVEFFTAFLRDKIDFALIGLTIL